MMTDPIADMLTRIRNANALGKEAVTIPMSKLKRNVLDVLKREGFITDYREEGEGIKKILRVYLKYGPRGEKVIRQIRRVSKPGRRVYRDVEELKKNRVVDGMGVAVVSTSKGVMSDAECRKAGVGGEVLCEVW